MICKLAKERAKVKKKQEKTEYEESYFMRTNKICPKCGCEKILNVSRKDDFCRTTIKCEDCGYTIRFVAKT